jgi:gliding motility-associated lipoprotein GldD
MKMKPEIFFGVVAAVIAASLASCDYTPVPRPRGYFRIETTPPKYTAYEAPCGLSLELPHYAKVELMAETCWFNLRLPSFHARLHCTYFEVSDNIDVLIDDAFSLAFKHEIKATAIGQEAFHWPERRVHGVVYDLEGPVASPVQFFATDSTTHFLRGSLYFDHTPNPDSLEPALAHVRNDVRHLIESIQWK